jgi:ADP-ribose pyrophosphatase YjhB (NUDIX family)
VSHCRECGSRLTRAVPDGDNAERELCPACGYVDYENPRILTTCMVHEGNRLLWIRRAQPPDAGKWAIPGGFVECGENLQEAASREVEEETGVRLDPWSMSLYGIGSLPLIGQVYVTFRAPLQGQRFHCTEEAVDVALFAASELDWADVAYPDINFHVRRFYREVSNSDFGIYLGEVNAERGVRVLECGKSYAVQRLVKDFQSGS